jgi:hypothetical protein
MFDTDSKDTERFPGLSTCCYQKNETCRSQKKTMVWYDQQKKKPKCREYGSVVAENAATMAMCVLWIRKTQPWGGMVRRKRFFFFFFLVRRVGPGSNHQDPEKNRNLVGTLELSAGTKREGCREARTHKTERITCPGQSITKIRDSPAKRMAQQNQFYIWHPNTKPTEISWVRQCGSSKSSCSVHVCVVNTQNNALRRYGRQKSKKKKIWCVGWVTMRVLNGHTTTQKKIEILSARRVFRAGTKRRWQRDLKNTKQNA